MLPEITLEISQNNKLIQTVSKEIGEHGLVKTIVEFQVIANTVMTKLIEDSGESGHNDLEEDSEDTENEEDICVLPKKKKK